MAISSISREEFKRIFPYDTELAFYIGEEVEWYLDDAQNVIGIIARESPGSGWSYTILRRNVLGDFLVSTLSTEFMDLQSARAACLQEMAASSDGQDRVGSPRN